MHVNKKRKAQMFIITMIFLIGFVYTIQYNLYQYSLINMIEPFERGGENLLLNIKNLFTETLVQSSTCMEAGNELEILKNKLLLQIFKGGYVIERLEYSLDCDLWDSILYPPLLLTVSMTTEKTETNADFEIFRFAEFDELGPTIENTQAYPVLVHENETVTIKADISDKSGVDTFTTKASIKDLGENEIALIDLFIPPESGGDIYSATYWGDWESGSYCSDPEGCHYLVDISACDLLGWCTEVRHSWDETPPKITNVVTTTMPIEPGQEISVSANVTDNFQLDESEIKAHILDIEENSIHTFLLSASIGNTYEGSWNSNGTEKSSFYVDITACDIAQNCVEFKSERDEAGPVITNADIIPRSIYPDESITITADISDFSGVDADTVITHIQETDEVDIDTLILNLSSGDMFSGTYSGIWDSTGFCEDPIGCAYYVDIIACDLSGICEEAENI